MPKIMHPLKCLWRRATDFAALRTLTALGAPAFLTLFASPSVALAGNFGLTVAYNNPAGANIGANLIYLGQTFAFEVGVGGLGGTVKDVDDDGDKDSTSGGLWGDVDLKVMFAQRWRPYIEAGFGMALSGGAGKSGGLSAGAGSPFAGVGLMFEGSTLLAYVAGDYKFESKDLFPVVGLGVKF